MILRVCLSATALLVQALTFGHVANPQLGKYILVHFVDFVEELYLSRYTSKEDFYALDIPPIV